MITCQLPTRVFYDNVVGNKAPNKLVPSYRTRVHYGTVGAILAGVGGVEFDGTLTYDSSPHATEASCIDCHMVELPMAELVVTHSGQKVTSTDAIYRLPCDRYEFLINLLTGTQNCC